MSDLIEEMSSFHSYNTNVDIVFVIDATRSMENTIGLIRRSALTFYERLVEKMPESGHLLTDLRIRVIWFRDMYFDGKQAIGGSNFFTMPDDKQRLEEYLSLIEAKGGYDDPETSLEALTVAMRSDFICSDEITRHIIVLFTDDAAHKLEEHDRLVKAAEELGCVPECYPDNMPPTLAEFYHAWNSQDDGCDYFGADGKPTRLDNNGRRLIIFAPDKYPWKKLSTELSNVTMHSIEAGAGGRDIDINDVYNMILFSW